MRRPSPYTAERRPCLCIGIGEPTGEMADEICRFLHFLFFGVRCSAVTYRTTGRRKMGDDRLYKNKKNATQSLTLGWSPFFFCESSPYMRTER